MGEYQNVVVSIEDRTAIITINHPPANSFDVQTVSDLAAAFDEVSADPQVKVIIITGAGQFFSAGADDTAVFHPALNLDQTDYLSVQLASPKAGSRSDSKCATVACAGCCGTVIWTVRQSTPWMHPITRAAGRSTPR